MCKSLHIFKNVNDLKVKELDTIRYVQSLGLTLTAIQKFAFNRTKHTTDVSLYSFNPGDWVDFKIWKNKHPHDQLELAGESPIRFY